MDWEWIPTLMSRWKGVKCTTVVVVLKILRLVIICIFSYFDVGCSVKEIRKRGISERQKICLGLGFRYLFLFSLIITSPLIKSQDCRFPYNLLFIPHTLIEASIFFAFSFEIEDSELFRLLYFNWFFHFLFVLFLNYCVSERFQCFLYPLG